MVKYCIYCGKQLEEGQICGCQQQDMPQMQNYPPVQQQVAYSPSVGVSQSLCKPSNWCKI